MRRAPQSWPSRSSAGTSSQAVFIQTGPRQQRKRWQSGLKLGSSIETDGIPRPTPLRLAA
jgi:hypothetical protein